MRTGFDMTAQPTAVDPNFMRVVVSIMRVLVSRVMETAIEFAQTCGRDTACGLDVKMALKYQAMTFFESEWENDYQEALREEAEHTYDTDDDTDDDDDDDAGDNDDDAGDNDDASTEFVRGNADLHVNVQACVVAWSTWDPADPIQSLVKKSVDKANQHGI